MTAKYASETQLIHEGTLRSQFAENSEAMFLTQGYRYESAEAALARFAGEEEGFIYSRYANPTVAMLERRMAAYEGAEDCFATASGMAACFASLACQLKAGDHIVSAKALFSSCLHIVEQLLPKWGIEVTLIDGEDLEAWENAIRPNTKVFFAEIMSNPRLEMIDVPAISKIAHSGGREICFVVDNVFATPVLQKTLSLGADVIFYSATKHIDGQGRVLGGLILGTKEFIRGPLEVFLRHTGPTMSAFNAWVMLKSLETLELRVNAQSDNAFKIAKALEAHPEITEVLYPHLKSHKNYALAKSQMSKGGTMITFELKGGRERAFKFLNALELIGISNNLGDAKSLMTHPATTTHFKLTDEQRAELNITAGLVRFSVGLENADDLTREIENALEVSK